MGPAGPPSSRPPAAPPHAAKCPRVGRRPQPVRGCGHGAGGTRGTPILTRPGLCVCGARHRDVLTHTHTHTHSHTHTLTAVHSPPLQDTPYPQHGLRKGRQPGSAPAVQFPGGRAGHATPASQLPCCPPSARVLGPPRGPYLTALRTSKGCTTQPAGARGPLQGDSGSMQHSPWREARQAWAVLPTREKRREGLVLSPQTH